ncbi:ATP-binding protein [Aldersonia sp. NBC_00410]|uniref:sensor histidine kinase n=1 Tax=Aldersonia sp. NBC_00410 TaxID=2975954 RepID=UPI0022543EAC|nr:ATP-binding protein [Aldersonia sp. NBC_00410]MCX5045715.1 ATP-binding protein [Aldersonia sp. NBC_00410]
MRWQRWAPGRWSVRTRAAVAAAVVVSVCLVVAVGVLLIVLNRSLTRTAESGAAARAAQIADEAGRDGVEQLDPALLATDAQIGAIQLIDSDGRVVAASNGAPAATLSRQVVPVGQQVGLGRAEAKDESFDLSLIGRGAVAAGEPVTIIVGADREPIETTVRRIGALLLAGAPLVVVLTVIGTYLLVGVALRPVESLRRRVSSISSSDLDRRVAVPATGDEVAQLASTMNEMLDRLQAGQRAQRRFVSDASHELRSPLSTITTALELAHGRPDLIDTAMVDDSLLPEARRMTRLVEDLLVLARSDENALATHRGDVDIDDLLLAEAKRLRAAGIGVATRITACRVRGDASALSRLVRNLADNAGQHSQSVVEFSCTTVGFDSKLKKPGVRITISDDGPGIPVADRDRIFERFERLDPTRTRASGGTGLGLAIVAEIVRAHHGTVAIGDRAGGGAEFTVELPSDEDHSARSEQY